MPTTKTLTVEEFNATFFARPFDTVEAAAAAAGGVQVEGHAVCVCQSEKGAIVLQLDNQQPKPRATIGGAEVLQRFSFYRGHVPPPGGQPKTQHPRRPRN